MSKYWRPGNYYDTGEKQYTYLKIWKHMPERCPRLAKIRRKMWVAKCWAIDMALDKKYAENAAKNA